MKNLMFMGILLAGLVGTGAFAADAAKPESESAPTATSKAAPKTMTPQQREKMAAMHEKMAACLRSDKPISECRTEMRKGCQDMMGKNTGCPMMGDMDGMRGRGMMRRSGPAPQ